MENENRIIDMLEKSQEDMSNAMKYLINAIEEKRIIAIVVATTTKRMWYYVLVVPNERFPNKDSIIDYFYKVGLRKSVSSGETEKELHKFLQDISDKSYVFNKNNYFMNNYFKHILYEHALIL